MNSLVCSNSSNAFFCLLYMNVYIYILISKYTNIYSYVLQSFILIRQINIYLIPYQQINCMIENKLLHKQTYTFTSLETQICLET